METLFNMTQFIYKHMIQMQEKIIELFGYYDCVRCAWEGKVSTK